MITFALMDFAHGYVQALRSVLKYELFYTFAGLLDFLVDFLLMCNDPL